MLQNQNPFTGNSMPGIGSAPFTMPLQTQESTDRTFQLSKDVSRVVSKIIWALKNTSLIQKGIPAAVIVLNYIEDKDRMEELKLHDRIALISQTPINGRGFEVLIYPTVATGNFKTALDAALGIGVKDPITKELIDEIRTSLEGSISDDEGLLLNNLADDIIITMRGMAVLADSFFPITMSPSYIPAESVVASETFKYNTVSINVVFETSGDSKVFASLVSPDQVVIKGFRYPECKVILTDVFTPDNIGLKMLKDSLKRITTNEKPSD